jgi:hypothetical protein
MRSDGAAHGKHPIMSVTALRRRVVASRRSGKVEGPSARGLCRKLRRSSAAVATSREATAGQDQAWKEVPHADVNRIENCRQVIAMMNSSIAGERNASGQGLPTDHTDELPAMMNKRFRINRREWS